MENVHVLPTDKPSRLYTVDSIGKLDWSEGYLHQVDGATNQNIYITSDEEIKVGDWCYSTQGFIIRVALYHGNYTHHKEVGNNHINCYKKIILTTDADLINNGVQAIDDEFLEWFVKNSSCKKIKIEKAEHGMYKDDVYCKLSNKIFYKIIIPKEKPKSYSQDDYFNDEFPNQETIYAEANCACSRFETNCYTGMCRNCGFPPKKYNKQETLEKAAENYAEYQLTGIPDKISKFECINDFIEGAKWQQERSYSEEEVLEMLNKSCDYIYASSKIGTDKKLMPNLLRGWFEQFKKK